MFDGYNTSTFEYFKALRFNNNRAFFHQTHDWYEADVRKPTLALAAALSEAVEQIDPNLERRANRVVSHINRDLRFSSDKTPYREYLWLSFRPPEGSHATHISLWFDVSDENLCNYGMGFYAPNRPLMRGLRHAIAEDASELLQAFEPIRDEFTLHTDAYKKMEIPASVPEALHGFYRAKSFYLEKHIGDFSLICSPALADEVRRGYLKLKPLYQYLIHLTPIYE